MKICKNCSASNEDQAKYCHTCGALLEEIEAAPGEDEDLVIELDKEPETEAKLAADENPADAAGERPYEAVWYYAKDQEAVGPFTELNMKEMIEGGMLHAKSLVWKNGMANWQLLGATELARYLPASQQASSSSFVPATTGLQKSIGLYLFLSIITCGLFAFYWIYSIADETNRLLAQNGKKQMDSALMTVIFSVITCGVYTIYFFWKEGRELHKLDPSSKDLSILYLILAAVSGGALACCFVQDRLNELEN